jgi:ferric-dicitrate binding protein FerR (iron transport regulator)
VSDCRDLFTGDDETTTVQLLRAAGPRPRVSSERVARVRSAVHGAWQARQHRLVLRRRIAVAALLGGALALVLFTARTALFDREMKLGEAVAVVEEVHGPTPGVERADTVRVGQWIETGGASRLALRFGRDTSVRLDVESRMRPLSSRIIEVSSGAIYVDTEDHGSLEIRTPFGVARDVGTQFEVRLAEQSLRLRVRAGLVELHDGARTIAARPGTEVTLGPSGAVTRPFAASDPEWAWVNRVAVPLEMEGLTLATFLARLARGQGWTVEYRDAEVSRRAQAIVLHGSVSGLSPHEAVEVAVATSGLRHRLSGGSLLVFGADSRLPAGRVEQR